MKTKFTLAAMSLVLILSVAFAVAPPNCCEPSKDKPPGSPPHKSPDAPCCEARYPDNRYLTSSAVMLYKDGNGIGSGTVIRHQGKLLVLTCAHVAHAYVENTVCVHIDKEGKATISTRQAYLPVEMETRTYARLTTKRKGRLLFVSNNPRVDLALVEPESETGLEPVTVLPPARLLNPGEDVWYCGYGNNHAYNLVKSIVNTPDDNGSLRVNGEGWYGHSGSGVLVRGAERCGVSSYALAGVVFGIRGNVNPYKAPVLAVSHVEVNKFLDLYTSHLKGKTK